MDMLRYYWDLFWQALAEAIEKRDRADKILTAITPVLVLITSLIKHDPNATRFDVGVLWGLVWVGVLVMWRFLKLNYRNVKKSEDYAGLSAKLDLLADRATALMNLQAVSPKTTEEFTAWRDSVHQEVSQTRELIED